jgi:hypothetical protein
MDDIDKIKEICTMLWRYLLIFLFSGARFGSPVQIFDSTLNHYYLEVKIIKVSFIYLVLLNNDTIFCRWFILKTIEKNNNIATSTVVSGMYQTGFDNGYGTRTGKAITTWIQEEIFIWCLVWKVTPYLDSDSN